MSDAILRFAPSPNGLLHLGHAYSALLNDAVARRLGGPWLLRMEDIDAARSRPAFEAAIYEDLAWLGLDWPRPVRRQSDHMAEYRAAAEALRTRRLLYPCVCTRADIGHEVAAREQAERRPWPRDPDGAPLYPGTCRGGARQPRGLVGQEGVAWRLDTNAALGAVGEPSAWTACVPDGPDRSVPAQPGRWGDVVLVRKDTPTSYHLSVVVDDAAQGVTHVVRGRDLEAATDLHALLQDLLSLPRPRYHHHRLILDRGGDKLSKSRSGPTLADLRAGGVTAGDVRRSLGFGDDADTPASGSPRPDMPGE